MNRLAVYTGTRNIYHDMLVSAKSLLYNKGADRVVFLIEDDAFPEELPNCISTMNVSGQTFFPPDGPNFKSRWTYMVMMRIALPKLFPDCERILSLDHDTIVRKPIDMLWDIDLAGYYFAAVEENQIAIRKHPYFNFGVVMHNLDFIREDQIDDVIINTINTTYFSFCEQDAVNELCALRIKPLPTEYNVMYFNRPVIPEDNVIIKHYAAQNTRLRFQDDYRFFDSLTWEQVFAHKKDDPSPYNHVTRHDILNAFITRRGFHSFLEIGTDTGLSIRNVHAESITSVDPDLRTPATHHMTSDAFFATCEDKYDLIFIDGLHEHNQAFRDVLNALHHLNPSGVIVMHDCLPTTELMQAYSDHYPGGLWTGDVWKAFVKARAEIPYEMYTIDTDFGCGVIDTSVPADPDKTLPSDMETMTYAQFVANRNNWMNVKGGIVDD